MVNPYRAPSADKDAVTYLPVDRFGLRRKIYPVTSPRSSTALGGVRLGHVSVFVRTADMPHLQAETVTEACDNIARGHEAYPSLVYLSRARVGDIEALLQAAQSEELRVRWERLWVLAPHLSRLSRYSEGQKALMEGFAKDIPMVHLLSKFAEQDSAVVRRLFKRLHDPLLCLLLKTLHKHNNDMRRAGILISIVSTLETQEDILRKSMPAHLSPTEIEELLAMLYTSAPKGVHHHFSSAVLRDRLVSFRR